MRSAFLRSAAASVKRALASVRMLSDINNRFSSGASPSAVTRLSMVLRLSSVWRHSSLVR